jgi:CheY-like chemotaxis protein
MFARCASAPAVALSGHARPEDAERALKAGFQRHVAKPVDADALATMLRELTSARPTVP